MSNDLAPRNYDFQGCLPDKNLPDAIEIEKALIGCVIMLPDSSIRMCKQRGLTTAVFSHPCHREIYDILLEMWEESSTSIDLMTATQRLEDRRVLEKVGGAFYIAEAATCVMAFNLEEYIRILIDKHTKRRLIIAHAVGMARAYDEQENAIELLRKTQQEILSISSTSAELREYSLTEEAIAGINAMIDARDTGAELGASTGIEAWDDELHGIIPSRFYALGARPKVGKSALVEQMVQHQNARGIATLVFQRDMSVIDMVGRMACRSAGVIYEDFIAGRLSAEDLMSVRLVCEEIDPKLLRIYSPQNMTAEELACIVEREIRESGIKVFYLDLFQRLKTGRKDKVEGLTDAANIIRDVIQNTGVSGVVIAEVLKEADKTGRPHSGQFKYCDGLFSSCDTSIMMWTDDDPKKLYNEQTKTYRRQRITFTIDANRGGTVGDETIYFDRPRMTFHNSP